MKPGTPIWWFRWVRGGNGELDKCEATFLCQLSSRVRIQLPDGTVRAVAPESIQVRKPNEKPAEWRAGDPITWFKTSGGASVALPATFLAMGRESRCGGQKVKIREQCGREVWVYRAFVETSREARA